jgi:hypothetical protein
MTTRLCLFPPEGALSLPPARVRWLRGRYDGLGGFEETNPLAVARAISFRELPERTADLLHSAMYLATDDGRQAIQEAVRGRRDLAPWLLLTAIDLAIDVARAVEAGDDAARMLQTRARTTGARSPARRELSLFAKTRDRPDRPESIVESGRAVHGGRFVDGWVVECRDATLRAIVVHEALSAAMRARSTRDEQNAGRRARGLACDTIRWDAARARVGLTLARVSKLPEWRKSLGIACAGDEAFFERRPLGLAGRGREAR